VIECARDAARTLAGQSARRVIAIIKALDQYSCRQIQSDVPNGLWSILGMIVLKRINRYTPLGDTSSIGARNQAAAIDVCHSRVAPFRRQS
jgi:hypothetical protein